MQKMNDNELRINGIEALNKTLGPVNAYRFMTLLYNEKTDYVEISHRIYKGQSLDNIYKRAKDNWEG